MRLQIVYLGRLGTKADPTLRPTYGLYVGSKLFTRGTLEKCLSRRERLV